MTSPRVGSLVRFGDVDLLAREIARFLGMPKDRDGIAAFAARFDWERPVEIIAARFLAALSERCPA